MIITSRTSRVLKNIDSSETHTIDFAQAWKMHDGSKNDKSFIFYSAPKDFRKSGGFERIWWVETDFGPYILNTEEHIKWISNTAGISIDFLKNLITKTPSDMVFSK